MANEQNSGPLPGVAGGPNMPTGFPASDDEVADAGRGLDTGTPGYGSGGVVPHEPVAPGVPSRANEGEDKGDVAPNADQALEDIKKGTR